MIPSRKRVLCVVAPGFEEIEAVAPIDLLRRAGAEVVLASLDGEAWVESRNKLAVRTDIPLGDVGPDDFDLFLVPGGPAVRALRADGRTRDLARRFVEAKKPVAAICAAPLILEDAGLLAGKRFTAHDSTYSDLPRALASERVVEDGLLTTSRGAGTSIDFGLALVRRLFGQRVADEVAGDIMA
jgi:4-methyl-5(b-hydroxyethyl)-thiazole monophosphate biosynthesis